MDASVSNDGGWLAPYFPVADAIAALFRPFVEVVIHDLEQTKIIYITNAISKRRKGDSSQGERFSEDSLKAQVIGPYHKVNPDGRNLRGITAVLRNDAGEPAAMMCINFDVSKLERIGEQIGALAFLPDTLEPHTPVFHENWRNELERMVWAFESNYGAAVPSMEIASRVELICELDAAGLLNVRNAPGVVAERIGMSRAALYKHLKRIRSRASS